MEVPNIDLETKKRVDRSRRQLPPVDSEDESTCVGVSGVIFI